MGWGGVGLLNLKYCLLYLGEVSGVTPQKAADGTERMEGGRRRREEGGGGQQNQPRCGFGLCRMQRRVCSANTLRINLSLIADAVLDDII